MALTGAEQVALDLAEFYELHEKPSKEWLPVISGRTLIAGHKVMPHVQSFADAVRKATGVQSIGTYPGHSPSIDRALDLFVPVNSRTLGDAICAYAIANQKRYGVRYIIYRQQIWHRLDQRWVPMADRGDLTQNHFDHVHISFETEAADEPAPTPTPTPEPEEAEGMKFIAVDNDRGIFLAGENVGEDGKIPARHAGSPADITALVETGAVNDYDKRPVLPESVFDSYYRVVG